jgi:hypothetical protein
MLGMVLLAIASPHAGADEPDLTALSTALDAPSWPDREDAVATLATDPRWRAADLEHVYRDDEERLSPEAQLRLIKAIKLRFLSEPRAAVGITADLSYDPASPLRVADLQPNSPAVGLLKPGDEIAAVDDLELPPGRLGWQMFSREIISRDPGEHVRLLRIRSGARQIIEVKLGVHPDGPLPVRRAIVERDYWSRRLERLAPKFDLVPIEGRLEDRAAVEVVGRPVVIEGARSDLRRDMTGDLSPADGPPLGRSVDAASWRSRVVVQWREDRTTGGELITVGPDDRRSVQAIPGGWKRERLDDWVAQQLAEARREGE